MSGRRPATLVREFGFGVLVAVAILWLTLFGDAGTVQIATLALTVVAGIWFATVDARRLVDSAGRPHLMLFFLAAVGVAVLATGMLIFSTVTLLLVLAVGLTGTAVGFYRALTLPPPVPQEGAVHLGKPFVLEKTFSIF